MTIWKQLRPNMSSVRIPMSFLENDGRARQELAEEDGPLASIGLCKRVNQPTNIPRTKGSMSGLAALLNKSDDVRPSSLCAKLTPREHGRATTPVKKMPKSMPIAKARPEAFGGKEMLKRRAGKCANSRPPMRGAPIPRGGTKRVPE